MYLRASMVCLLVGAAGVSVPCLAQERDFPGIEHLMDQEEYARAGLVKLTPAEISALNDWLARYTSGKAAVARLTNSDIQAAAAPARIEARIKPPFGGWDGDTVFSLDNGQVWRQRLPDRYRFDGNDTAVVIKKNLFGFYVMTLTATGRTVGVARVR